MSRSKPAKKMDLILWRHAEAEERSDKLPDADRRLTPRGQKQARRMAKWLKKRLPKKVRILVSPTERTRMTAQALDSPFEIKKDLGSGADAVDLLAAAGWPEAGGTVLLVGHQPALGNAAALLLVGHKADWQIRKSGVWWISKPSGGDESRPRLHVAISPDLLRATRLRPTA